MLKGCVYAYFLSLGVHGSLLSALSDPQPADALHIAEKLAVLEPIMGVPGSPRCLAHRQILMQEPLVASLFLVRPGAPFVASLQCFACFALPCAEYGGMKKRRGVFLVHTCSYLFMVANTAPISMSRFIHDS